MKIIDMLFEIRLEQFTYERNLSDFTFMLVITCITCSSDLCYILAASIAL